MGDSRHLAEVPSSRLKARAGGFQDPGSPQTRKDVSIPEVTSIGQGEAAAGKAASGVWSDFSGPHPRAPAGTQMPRRCFSRALMLVTSGAGGRVAPWPLSVCVGAAEMTRSPRADLLARPQV